MAHYPINHHLRPAYRVLAGAAGIFLTLVGVLGLAATWGDPFFHRGHDWVLGLRVNPAGAWLATLAGLAILAAVLLGGNVLHRLSVLLGWGLLAVAMVLLALLQTDANVLNVSMVNVIVLTVVGLVVLTAGLYGKVGSADAGRKESAAAHNPA